MTNIIESFLVAFIPISLLVSLIGWAFCYISGDLIFNGKRKKKKKYLYCIYCGDRFVKKRFLRRHYIKSCNLFFNFSFNPEWFRSVI